MACAAVASDVSSILVGTSGLTIAAIVALVLAVTRVGVAPEKVTRLRRVGSLLVIVQAAHFAEEYLLHFHVRFPELLGLTPWPGEFFLAFNIAWVVIWVAAIAGMSWLPHIAAFPLWFPAIASTANGLVHPLLSLAAAGYFPGLWTSPFVGILGAILLRSLASEQLRRTTSTS